MSKTIKATPEQIKEMLEHYKGYLVSNNSVSTIGRARLENVVITFYATNTVLFQGIDENTEYNVWAEKYGLDKAQTEESDYSMYENLSIIGCDEVGTGDYFGPVVVCSAFVRSDQITELKRLGVKDSKLLMDDIIIDLALKLRTMITYSILVLPPEKFNALHKTENDNLNFIKACLHNNAINSILKKIENVKYDAIIIDEFTPVEKYYHYLRKVPVVTQGVKLIPRGEKVHVAVAAASILARAAFLKEMKELSKLVNVDLLKGASSSVDRQAVSIIKSYGYPILDKVAKKKYANTQKVVDYMKTNNIKIRDYYE